MKINNKESKFIKVRSQLCYSHNTLISKYSQICTSAKFYLPPKDNCDIVDIYIKDEYS
jgi:hypothetical protein